MARYIWQQDKWPRMTWRAAELEGVLSQAAFAEGKLVGALSSIGFDLRNRAGFETISDEIVSSAAIEGETLNRADVRSSVARRMEIALQEGKEREDHALDARVEMLLDATRGWDRPMSVERLNAWHAALFPTGYSGLSRIRVAAYRDDSEGPMRVVSRYGSLMRTHFEAPPATRLGNEMTDFLVWLNESTAEPFLVKAALAHLRFLTLHPYEDGNGRLARTMTEWVLSRGEKSPLRFYSLSAEIQREKSAYYEELEHAQRNSLDVTRWIGWFVGCHARAVAAAMENLSGILRKAEFWNEHRDFPLNEHQQKILNLMLDDFEGHLTSSKWAKICKVSQDTAGREIDQLVSARILFRQGQGRSTHYTLG